MFEGLVPKFVQKGAHKVQQKGGKKMPKGSQHAPNIATKKRLETIPKKRSINVRNKGSSELVSVGEREAR